MFQNDRRFVGGRRIGFACRVALVGLLCTTPSAALAVDGVLEINQACAVNTGCFSGDASGFPVTIDGSAGLSYRLTGDLSTSDPAVDGIHVTVDDVSIDLNGFVMKGIAGIGGGHGINLSDGVSGVRGFSIRNGTIRQFKGSGIDNPQSGGGFGWVVDVRVAQTDVGLNLGPVSIVERCISTFNNGAGIAVGGGSRVEGSHSSFNFGDGIDAGSTSTLVGNTAINNSGTGLVMPAAAGYSGNVVVGNTATVTGGVELGPNLCETDTTCP